MKVFLLLIILLCLGSVLFVYREEIGIDKYIGGSSEEVVEGSNEEEDMLPTFGGTSAEEIPEDDKKLQATIAEELPLPTFKPIDELMGNWLEIPQKIFNPPREIILQRDVRMEFPGGAGGVDANRGSSAFVVSSSGPILTVRKQKDGSMSAKVTIDDTDLKQRLEGIYEEWKRRKNDIVLNERARVFRERRQARLAAAAVAAGQSGTSDDTGGLLSAAELNAIGQKPVMLEDGRVSIMVDSIKRGDVTEIKLDEIQRWGPVRGDRFEGEPFWVASVFYETPSLFGLVKAEAMALMRGGRVIDWVYPGSGEDVP
ncbi:MAG: hypothetical protein AAGJ79_09765 [Verrucomicrobiota bacterium]